MQFGREWTKFAVRFREVSGLESVRLERVDCIDIAVAVRQHENEKTRTRLSRTEQNNSNKKLSTKCPDLELLWPVSEKRKCYYAESIPFPNLVPRAFRPEKALGTRLSRVRISPMPLLVT